MDDTQKGIVTFLRRVGVTVFSIADVGNGCPDLLVGYRKRTYLVEVKDGAKPASARALTEKEARWHDTWDGSPVLIWLGVDDAAAWFAARQREERGT